MDMSDLISREDAVNEIHKYFFEEINKIPCTKDEDGDEVYTDMPTVNSLLACNKELSKRIKALLSADAVPQSDQYKKGFEDAKRAFELEFAREAESIRKQNAQLEVMLNIQKALLAERNWIPCSERLPEDNGDYLVCPSDGVIEDYSDCSDVMIMPYDADCEAFGWWTERYDPISLGFVDSDFNEFEVIAWMPLPKPYREESEVEE